MHAQRFTVFAAMASALAGTLTGSYLVEKMTYRTIQFLVSVMVLGIAVSLFWEWCDRQMVFRLTVTERDVS